MILAINIGNTNIHFAVFNKKGKNLITEQIPTTKARKFFIKSKLKKITSKSFTSSITKILLSSTHPSTERLINLWSKRVFGLKPLKAGKDFKIPIKVKVKKPKKVGTDRLLNAYAAYKKVKKACLVIDFGTAITFDLVSSRGEFLGGAISAGINTMAKSLHKECEQLPLVKIKPIAKAIGKDTIEAIDSGIYLGTVGLTKFMIERMISGMKKKPRVVATGGDAELVKKGLSLINEVIPDLTLKGLFLAKQL